MEAIDQAEEPSTYCSSSTWLYWKEENEEEIAILAGWEGQPWKEEELRGKNSFHVCVCVWVCVCVNDLWYWLRTKIYISV